MRDYGSPGFALIGVCEPHYVDLNNAISDEIGSRLDLAQLHDHYVCRR